ncbi:hypothetical protein [Kitasatospora sp. NRRL B-11411]|uniref:hypothetical protein n=1 Tax=Kitasatospora sp. NRRL B-11411 TaxID=1463822 RepID=UPI00068FF166|nr:hypothetical protein [Kitasatospora sp. NRRL B-11411]
MTPHPPSEHPDLDALADLAEELLPPARAAALHAHLADCPSCAEDFAALSGLPELLADLPAPALPQDVADRLSAALAAESAARTERHPRPGPADPARPAPATPTAPHRSGAPPSAPAGSPSGATGPGRPARRRRGARLLLTTAAVAVVALAVGLGGSLLDRGSDGKDSSTSAAAPADATGRPSVGGSPAPATAPHQVAPGGGTGEGGPDFTAGRLPAQVRQLLEGKSPHQLGAASPDGPAAAPACALAAAGHPDEQPTATGPGRYQGRPVLALVFRPPGGSGPLDVYLATPDCPGSTILLHSTVPAP